MADWLDRQTGGPWIELLKAAAAEYEMETGGVETSLEYFIEWLAEWGREFRRRQSRLLLTTAHRAKGLEFNHVVVLDGAWDRIGKGEDRGAPRRLYYVAMTRARQTLTLMRLPGRLPFQDALQGSPSVLHRPAPLGLPTPAPELARLYRRLSLGDVFLSYAGYRPAGHPVHRAIADLSPGELLQIRKGSKRLELLDRHGTVVGQLSTVFRFRTACVARLPQPWLSLPGIGRARKCRIAKAFAPTSGKWLFLGWYSSQSHESKPQGLRTGTYRIRY